MTTSEFDITAKIDGWELDVKALDITLDDAWSPYCQATLTVASPGGILLETIDPRQKKRVQITVTQKFSHPAPMTLAFFTQAFSGRQLKDVMFGITTPNVAGLTERLNPYFDGVPREPVSRTFDLSLRARRRSHVAGELELTLMSDEAVLNTVGLVTPEPYTGASTGIRYITVETLVLAGIDAELQGEAHVGRVPEDGHTWQPGVKAWEFLTPILQAGGARLWCDENRVWWLDRAEKVRTDSITLSHLDTITEPTDTISLDDQWYDAVVITYSWTDAANEQHTRWDIAQSVPRPQSTLALQYDTPYPGPGAAARVLDRAAGRGRVFGIRAVSDLTTTPGMRVRVDLPDTPIQSGYVSAVTWSFPADEMTVRTRELSDTLSTAWIFAEAGLTWNDLPEGLTWADYTAQTGVI